MYARVLESKYDDMEGTIREGARSMLFLMTGIGINDMRKAKLPRLEDIYFLSEFKKNMTGH